MTSKGHFRQVTSRPPSERSWYASSLRCATAPESSHRSLSVARHRVHLPVVAKLTINLRQRRCAQRVIALPKSISSSALSSVESCGVMVDVHLPRGQMQKSPATAATSFALFVTFLPAGFHRHRVFTHGIVRPSAGQSSSPTALTAS